MDAVNKAKSEKELVDLVRANYMQGFSSASMSVAEGDLHMKLIVQWVGK